MIDMCGIAGIIRLDGSEVERQRIEAMNIAMQHRGPDGQGCLINGSVGFGHLRLAIIDLVTGDQPMSSDDGTVHLIFNGEIYNFPELKSRLTSLGHRFHTTSDTEVILHAYQEWGVDLLSHLNGMFAFAIYDSRKNTIMLARDRLGVKPLYYYLDRDKFVFASEMSGLLASGLIPREIDLKAMELYLHYQYVPSPYTIYKNVNKLSPAHFALLNIGDGSIRTECYWHIDTNKAPDQTRSKESWMEELDDLLNDAVRIRLISDVPFGAFLSGGVDSGIVVAMMAGKMDEPVKTFSIGFDGIDDDELPYARIVAEKYHTTHEEFRVTPEGLSLIPKLCVHFGEPFADSSAIPTYYVAKIARSRVKMVLTGDGGDETFGGYRTYPNLLNMLAKREAAKTSWFALPPDIPVDWKLAPRLAKRALKQAIKYGKELLQPANDSLPSAKEVAPWIDIFNTFMSHFHYDERRALLGRDFDLSEADFMAERFPFPAADSVVGRAQYIDLKSYLTEDGLVKVDRMSMVHSLEVRSPFLDYRVAELAFSMPTNMKVPEMVLDGTRNKYVLKELAATKYLSHDYVYRPKEGFGIPINRWLREDKDGYIRDTLMDANSPIYQYVDRAYAQNMISRHLNGTWDNGYKLWNLLMLDGWLRYVDKK